MRRAALLAGLLAACTTVSVSRGVPGGTHATAKLGELTLHRWMPTADALAQNGAKVVVIPELGFDHRLVAKLCERLQNKGFDVVTFDRSEQESSLVDDARALVRVVQAHGGKVKVLAIGIGGEAAFALADAGMVSGIVAVNVPLRHEIGNVALASALADDLFSPAKWIRDDRAQLVLGGGRSTTEEDVDAMSDAAVPLAPTLSAEVAHVLASHAPVTPPKVPLRVFASVKDNLVHPEDALFAADPKWRPDSARRLGKLEYFARDYGHLDWLTSDEALDDVTPVLADALEALP